MDYKKRMLLKNYISNIQVNVLQAGHAKIWPEWRDIDYTPNYNKFYFILDGEGWLKIGDREYFPKPGQLFLMPEGIKQSYSTINKNTFKKYWCHFTAKIGDINLFDVIDLPYFIDVKDMSIPEEIFCKLVVDNESLLLSSSLKVKADILELISYYIDNTVIEKIKLSPSENIAKLNQVIDYIDNNLSRNITVEQLSQITHLHPNYFIRFFKKHFGDSPIHYLNKRRMEEAKRLLETTDSTLVEISDRTGVNDIFYLSKLFKEYTGFSPSEYRKMTKK